MIGHAINQLPSLVKFVIFLSLVKIGNVVASSDLPRLRDSLPIMHIHYRASFFFISVNKRHVPVFEKKAVEGNE